jgi:hypothetical protein
MFHSAAGRKAFSLQTANAAPLDEEEEAIGTDDGDEDEPVDPQRTGVTGGQKGKGEKRKKSELEKNMKDKG